MPLLIEQGRLRECVHELSLLNIDSLVEYKQLRLAQLLLTTTMAGYIWSHGENQVHSFFIIKNKGYWNFSKNQVPRSLPRQIAVPLWEVCGRLGGVKPTCNHMCACLANYYQVDSSRPLNSDNMRLISAKFISDFDNEWFFINTAQIELDFAPAIPKMLQIIRMFIFIILGFFRFFYLSSWTFLFNYR